MGGLRDRPRVHRALVLRAPGPLPDAVLLAVRQRRVRAGVSLDRALDPGDPADHPLRLRLAALRARLPADLLLLSGRLLPRVLALARRVRGARAARAVLRRDQGAADRAEPAPLLLLRRVRDRAPAHLGRGAGLPRPER